MTKTALVTGGTGFIGHNLANALSERGYRVTVIDKALNNYKHLSPNVNLILSDIRKVEFTKPFDVIYHLAALRSLPQSFIFPEEYISNNIWGTYNIIKSFPSSRVVFASSSAATEAKCVYGATKRSAEHFVNMHKNSVSIRFMNVFGERETDLQFAVPAFCYALKHNQKAIINGDGTCKRDFTYVHDLVEEIIRIGESKIKGQTEIGYAESIGILDLYKKLAKLHKKELNFSFGPARKGDVKKTCSKFKIKEPKYGFAEGLRRTVRWYLEEETF
jgi:UDP-glucose 4-epimerase